MHHDLTPELYPVRLTVARLYTDKPFHADGNDLRRAVTALFPDRALLHHHAPDGGPDYSMPPVRYLVMDHVPHLVGIGKGREVVGQVASAADRLMVRDRRYAVTGRDFIEDGVLLGLSPELLSYSSHSPWLALNQSNTLKFHELKDPEQRNRLLERILTGNLLSLAKGLDIHINGRILLKVTSHHGKKVWVPKPMMGFWVSFVSNLVLPEFLGLGKMVSKGFGLMRNNG